jgi:hypothetical protein
MDILIEKIDGNIIYYKAKYGESKGEWADDTLPTVNQEYVVELDAKEIFKKNVNIFVEKENNYKMYLNEEEIVFVGNLENIDDDGVAALRIGDNILLIRIVNGEFTDGEMVRLVTQKISLYPYD